MNKELLNKGYSSEGHYVEVWSTDIEDNYYVFIKPKVAVNNIIMELKIKDDKEI